MDARELRILPQFFSHHPKLYHRRVGHRGLVFRLPLRRRGSSDIVSDVVSGSLQRGKENTTQHVHVRAIHSILRPLFFSFFDGGLDASVYTRGWNHVRRGYNDDAHIFERGWGLGRVCRFPLLPERPHLGRRRILESVRGRSSDDPVPHGRGPGGPYVQVPAPEAGGDAPEGGQQQVVVVAEGKGGKRYQDIDAPKSNRVVLDYGDI